MKTTHLLLLVTIFTLGAAAWADNQPAVTQTGQIRSGDGKFCARCQYTLEDDWVTQVVENGKPWTLKPKEPLYIIPLGMLPEVFNQRLFRVSPNYKAPEPTDTPASPSAKPNP